MTAQKHVSTEPEVLTLRQPQFSFLRTERTLTAHLALLSRRHWTQVTAAPIAHLLPTSRLALAGAQGLSPGGRAGSFLGLSHHTQRAWCLAVVPVLPGLFATYRRLPLLLFQSWASGPSCCLCQAREKSYTLCGGGFSSQGPFVQKHEPKWTPSAEPHVAQRSWV